MELDSQDRRERIRIFFTLEEKINFTATPTDNSKNAFPGTLLSISSGGLSFAADKKQRKNLQEGEEFWISRLHLPGVKETFASIKAEIKYIIHYKQYDLISIGCTYKAVPDSIVEGIDAYINSRMEYETEEDDSPGFEVS